MLIEDGSAFAVAGEDGGVVGQAEKSFLDALAERFVIAASEVGAPDAAAKECVAGEDPAFHFGIEAHAALGMAWRTNHFQGALPYSYDFAVFQVEVGQIDMGFALGSEAEPHRLSLGLNEVGMRVGMGRHLDAIAVLDGVVSDDVVDVTVRVDDHQRLEAVAVDEAKELVFLAGIATARVDDDAVVCSVVVNDVCAFREGIEDEGFEFEHDLSFDAGLRDARRETQNAIFGAKIVKRRYHSRKCAIFAA